MKQSHQDRRALDKANCAATAHPEVVRRGLQIQAAIGTIGALEFLTTRGISHEVSRRVLAGIHIRMEDSGPTG